MSEPTMRSTTLTTDGAFRFARTDGTHWFDSVRTWSPASADPFTTGDVETAVIVLAGTFDLAAGSTTWPARGARSTPFEGRPMAVFLPPRTPFRATGQGELLLVAARQPERPDEPTGRSALTHKPLLPLAGSGKSFDPTTGEWRPAETFPSSPESLPPRRMQRLDAGGIAFERVFAPDYKALTISADECVVPPGRELSVRAMALAATPDDVLLFVRSERRGRVRCGRDVYPVSAGEDVVLWGAGARVGELGVEAVEGRLYTFLAYAGKSR